ncbi:chain length determinant family protein [Streptomonospora sp. S1-112]|uniref:Chain length determinant family protein n=1 Tax=Streptomonospora mangrovi TaxID=2883123 RepID=A0A9X3NLS1_9ACTN|nr:Wzz/FepE/Etk N-terminal domain-containing protein [Streptomonospora mangrovi]MDA0564438.1 chain length determinant family protein [Streptomonospora mangrovi]
MDTAAGPDLKDVAATLRRRWRLVVAFVVGGLLLAALALLVAPRTYTATTAVHVRPSGIPEVTGEQSGRTNGEINLDTEAQIVSSARVADDAAGRLGGVDPVELRRQVEVSVPPNSSVLEIAFSASTPDAARDGSAAFADAYLDYRAAQVQNQIGDRVAALQSEIDSRYAELDELASAADTGGTQQARVTAVQNEIAQLSTDVAPLNTLRASVEPAEVISPAVAPRSAESPMPLLWLAAGAALGLAAGVAAAYRADRGAGRLHTARDIARTTGLPTLLDLSDSRRAVRTGPTGRAGSTPAAPGSGRTGHVETIENAHPALYDGPAAQRANEVAHALSARLFPADRQEGAVVLVAGVSPGRAATTAAVGVAAALARIGADVLLVCADPADREPAHHLGLPADQRGLAEVLAEGADPARLEQQASAVPGLRVLRYGEAEAVHLLQRPDMVGLLGRLRHHARFVVVAAAPTSERADAHAWASSADLVLPAVDLGRTRAEDLRDTVDALGSLGGVVAGAIAVPSPAARIGGASAAARAAVQRGRLRTVKRVDRPRSVQVGPETPAPAAEAPAPSAPAAAATADPEEPAEADRPVQADGAVESGTAEAAADDNTAATADMYGTAETAESADATAETADMYSTAAATGVNAATETAEGAESAEAGTAQPAAAETDTTASTEGAQTAEITDGADAVAPAEPADPADGTAASAEPAGGTTASDDAASGTADNAAASTGTGARSGTAAKSGTGSARSAKKPAKKSGGKRGGSAATTGTSANGTSAAGTSANDASANGASANDASAADASTTAEADLTLRR